MNEEYDEDGNPIVDEEELLKQQQEQEALQRQGTLADQAAAAALAQQQQQQQAQAQAAAAQNQDALAQRIAQLEAALAQQQQQAQDQALNDILKDFEGEVTKEEIDAFVKERQQAYQPKKFFEDAAKAIWASKQLTAKPDKLTATASVAQPSAIDKAVKEGKANDDEFGAWVLANARKKG
jgi:hypothetical protein